MIWKPAAVKLANVKSKNVGSYFEAQQILSSPVLNQVRAHTNIPANILGLFDLTPIHSNFIHLFMSAHLCLDLKSNKT